jgi:hypothetical protein
MTGIAFEAGVRVLATPYAAANDFFDLNNDGITDHITTVGVNKFAAYGLGGGLFAPEVPVTFPGTPTVDFNHDGFLDYFNFTSGTLHVVLAASATTWAPEVTYSTPSGASAAGDINDDGFADIVVVTSSGASVNALINKGDGTFNAAITSTGPGATSYIAIGDFDGDGFGDYATNTKVAKGNGDGTFQAPVTYSSNNTVDSNFFGVADFNNDGKDDFYNDAVYLGGSPTLLTVKTSSVTIPAPGSIAATGSFTTADFNGDGLSDLAYGTSVEIHIYFNKGNATFTGNPDFSFNHGMGALIKVDAIDFNSDGKPDIVTNESTPSYLASIFVNNGDGSFTSTANYTNNDNRGNIALGDLNNDDRADIVNAEGFRLANADGSLSALVPFANGAIAVSLGDVNGDNKLDIVTASNTAKFTVFVGNGNGTFQLAFDVATTGNVSFLKLADVNNDNCDDVFVYAAGGFAVYLNNGFGAFTTSKTTSATNISGFPALGDFNDDGKIDIAIRGATDTGNYSIFRGNGAGDFTRFNYNVGNTFSVTSVAAGDFNNDGVDDLAATLTTNSLDETLPNLKIFLGKADGTMTLKTTVELVRNARFATVSDFNNDGILDIATSHTHFFDYNALAGESTGSVVVLRGTGGGNFDVVNIFSALPTIHMLDAGDIDGDGRIDIAVGGINAARTPVAFALLFNSTTGAATDTALALSQSSITYGNAATFTATVTAGIGVPNGAVQFLVDGVNFGAAVPLVNGVAAAPAALSAANHVITANFIPADLEYAPSSDSDNLLVNKAPLNLTVDAKSKTYAQPNPALTGLLAGVVNGDNITVTYSTSATTFSHPGSYAINAVLKDPQNKLANYEVVTAGANLTISKADQTITWTTPADIFAGDPLTTKQLNAKVSHPAGGSANGIFSYDHDLGEFLVAGDHLLTVTAAATQDYNETSASVILHVKESGPDLKVSLGKSLPGSVIRPGETLRIPITVQNVGNFKADASKTLPIEVRVYNSDDDQFDPGDPLLVPSFFITAPLAKNAKKVFTATVKIPADYVPGSFFVNADINDPNVGADPDAENNHLPTNVEFKVDNQFGKIPNRTPLATFTGVESDGTKFTFTLSGPGYGVVIPEIPGFSNFAIELHGTTSATSLTVTTVKSQTPGDDGLLTLDYISTSDPAPAALNSIKAVTTRLKGLVVTGLNSLSVHSVPGGVLNANFVKTFAVANHIESATIALGNVTKFTVGGNITDSYISSNNPGDPALGSLTAKQIIASQFYYYGKVASFKATLLQDSGIYLGFSGVFTGYPTAPADWFNTADYLRIDSLTIGTFTNSIVAAVRVGTTKITTITDLDGITAPFGFATLQAPGVYTGPASTGDYISPLDSVL